MMTSLSHGHFRFRFPSHLHFFVFRDLCTGAWRYFWNFSANLWAYKVPKTSEG